MEVHSSPTYQDFSVPQNPIDFRVPNLSPSLRDTLADASHELKTPLSSIRNSLTLLKIGAAGPIPKDAQEVLDVVERSTIRLIGLVEELLSVQRIALKLEALAVGKLTTTAAEMLAGEARAANIDIQLPQSQALVYGDAKRLLQVLVNLLSNAIKFSPPGSTIRVHTRDEVQYVTILVSDQGVGLCDGDQDRIFNRYHQGTYKNDQGSGLGLAISKQIADDHNAQIGAYNNMGESGATFWIRLNRIPPA
ncbi:MAG: HAMP domain-containing sensor histidine kinase [Candidatus Obscuribacterales bacterium]